MEELKPIESQPAVDFSDTIEYLKEQVSKACGVPKHLMNSKPNQPSYEKITHIIQANK